MIEIKKDPLSTTISLIFNLNLLEENKEYNINEIKGLRNLENHWITIQKYAKIFSLVQKYCPEIELIDSKLKIKNSKIFNNLSVKERFILFLFNQNALTSENAIHITDDFDSIEVLESKGYLYEETSDNQFYLTKAGLNIYRLLKQNLSDLIFNEKEIDEVFPKKELLEEEVIDEIEAIEFRADTPKLNTTSEGNSLRLVHTVSAISVSTSSIDLENFRRRAITQKLHKTGASIYI